MAFTIIEASVGGLFIQLATTNYYLQLGQTIGFSSAIGNTIWKGTTQHLPLLLGVLSSNLIVNKWFPEYVPEFPVSNLVQANGWLSNELLFAIAGGLVGIGTKLGSGCTSGHMLAGLSRLRVRSLAAVASFASVGIALSKILNIGIYNYIPGGAPNYQLALNTNWFKDNIWLSLTLSTSAFQVYYLLPKISSKGNKSKFYTAYIKYFSGLLFGLGLHISGMVNVGKTLGFLSILDINKFDPSLLMIMIFAVLPNIFIWKSIKKPLINEKFDCANSNEIPLKFLIGNVIFGAGWGILGICPGPGLINTFHYLSVSLWLVSFVTGYGIAGLI